MRKIISPIILLLCICCKATRENSGERVDKSNMNIPSDVVIIKDSFPMSDDFYGFEKEYFVSRNYIGFRYENNQDTVIEDPVPKFSPKVMKEIHSYGKDIIPYLISQIDRGKKVSISSNFVNPYDSNLRNMVMVGVNYAYMIELILGKDSIMDNVAFADGNGVWYEKMKLYRLYGQCVIIRKKDKDNPQKSKMTVDDMKTIKAIYNKWWESNKDKNLDALRKKWREEGSPLQNSPYMWI